MPGPRTLLGALIAALLSLLILSPQITPAQQILQNGFEGRATHWKPGSTDCVLQVLEHRLTEDTAHGGQRCEHLRLQVERGSFIHYTLDLPRAPITEELNLSLWVKSNRPNIQLLCRMVFPRERDPDNAGQPLSVIVRCEPYKSTRWKLLGLREPVKRLREQQQLLNHQLGREVVSTGAYIDQLILNLYDGPGQIDVWIDDLEIGPVEETRPVVPRVPLAGTPARPSSRRAAEVQLRGKQLFVGGKRFFLRGIRHTGNPPLRILREAGFNVVWLDESTPSGLVEDAANLGLWIVPTLTPPQHLAHGSVEGTLTSREDPFGQKVSRFLEHDAVLAWDLGSNLSAEHFSHVSKLARSFRLVDSQRPVIADIWDGYRGYSRNVEQLLFGTHRWPLMTAMELTEYRRWLDMRRELTADGYCWTWIQTHLPDWFLALNPPGKEGFEQPLGPQPEQIRLLTYTALSAGYRGLAFWSDRFLADSHQGKDRLLAMALLNQELQMLERLLVNTSAPDWIPTSRPEVMAAVFRTPEGVLVLPIWMGAGSQFVPGQAASSELSLTIPGVPITATAWEVSPGRIQSYPLKRELGGTTIKLRNFSLTSAVVFTSDLSPNGLIVRLQDQQRRMGRLAAQWLHDQAREELTKVEKVQAELDRLGRSLSDAPSLLDRCRRALDQSMQHRRNGEHGEAYAQAEIALRALRVLMRAHWERAVRDLDTPVASPHAISFYTLPRHWQMLDEMKKLRPAASVLPEGDFEQPPQQQQPWLVQKIPSLDEVEVTVKRVSDEAHAGKQSLMLQVRPKEPQRPPAALERTFVALHSPTARLEPGSLVRISAWVKIPKPIQASVDGALFFDSAGGEPLAARLVHEIGKWKKISLYRRVPADGRISVTLALSGLGTVYFDDVLIEPLVPAHPSTNPSPSTAMRGNPR